MVDNGFVEVFGVDLPSLPVEIPELQLPHVPGPP